MPMLLGHKRGIGRTWVVALAVIGLAVLLGALVWRFAGFDDDRVRGSARKPNPAAAEATAEPAAGGDAAPAPTRGGS